MLHKAGPPEHSRLRLCVPCNWPGYFTASITHLPAHAILKCTLRNSPADRAALKLLTNLSHQGLQLSRIRARRCNCTKCICLVALHSRGVKPADNSCQPFGSACMHLPRTAVLPTRVTRPSLLEHPRSTAIWQHGSNNCNALPCLSEEGGLRSAAGGTPARCKLLLWQQQC